MWTNPRYRELTGQDPPGRATASAEGPKPSGETLATLLRRGPNGVEQRLRIALDCYEGHEYVSVRLWEGGRPTKKGCSLRMAELPVVVAALQKAMGLDAPERFDNVVKPSAAPAREAPPRRRQRPEGRRDWDRDGSAGKPAVNLGDEDAY